MVIKLSWITGGRGVSHMCKFIAFRRCGMRDLTEEFRRNGTVEDQIAIEQLYFFDRLPSPDRCWGVCGARRRSIVTIFDIIVLRLKMRVRSVSVIRLQNRSLIVVILVIMCFLGILVGQGVWPCPRLIGLLEVGVVMLFGRYCIIVARVLVARR